MLGHLLALDKHPVNEMLTMLSVSHIPLIIARKIECQTGRERSEGSHFWHSAEFSDYRATLGQCGGAERLAGRVESGRIPGEVCWYMAVFRGQVGGIGRVAYPEKFVCWSLGGSCVCVSHNALCVNRSLGIYQQRTCFVRD